MRASNPGGRSARCQVGDTGGVLICWPMMATESSPTKGGRPVTIFGFELEPNPFLDKDYAVDFILMSGPTIVGNITITVNGSYGARLFAASITDGGVDKIVIDGEADFAIAQVRYILSPVVVDIDIKPGSYPNSINLKKTNGVIPVAILGSATFDVTTIDVTTLSFGPGGASPAHDLIDPEVYADHLQDVNGDGLIDLVSHYVSSESSIMSGDISACLSGEYNGGLPFTGCDSVRTLH